MKTFQVLLFLMCVSTAISSTLVFMEEPDKSKCSKCENRAVHHSKKKSDTGKAIRLKNDDPRE